MPQFFAAFIIVPTVLVLAFAVLYVSGMIVTEIAGEVNAIVVALRRRIGHTGHA
jgi:hypothetical protein